MELTKPQAVLFDLDGTLLDTAPDLMQALNNLLKEEQRPCVDEVQFRPTISDGSPAMLALGFGETLSQYDFTALRTRFFDHYQTLGTTHSRLFDGISELIAALQNKAIKVAIVTNKPTFLTMPIVKSLIPLDTIEVVICGDTLARAKPHPDQLLLACQQLGVTASECWYVGDAERDVEAAKAANMKAITAMWGYVPSTKVAHSWNADQYATNPKDVIHNI